MIRRLTAGILSLPILLTALSDSSFPDDLCLGRACKRPNTEISQEEQSIPLTFSQVQEGLIIPNDKQISRRDALTQYNHPIEGHHNRVQDYFRPSTEIQIPLEVPSDLQAPNKTSPTPQPIPDYNLQIQTYTPLTPKQVAEYTHKVIANLNFPAFPLSNISTREGRNQWWDILDFFPNKQVAVYTQHTRFQQDGGMGLIDTLSELGNFAFNIGSQYNTDNPVNPSKFERHCGALAIPPEYVRMVEGPAAFTEVTTNFDKMVAVGSKGLEVIPYTNTKGEKSYLGNAEKIRSYKLRCGSCVGEKCE